MTGDERVSVGFDGGARKDGAALVVEPSPPITTLKMVRKWQEVMGDRPIGCECHGDEMCGACEA